MLGNRRGSVVGGQKGGKGRLTLEALMSAKDLAIAQDDVELLVQERLVGREGGHVGMRGRDTGDRGAHLVRQQGDVAEGHVNLGVRIRVGPGFAKEHLVPALGRGKTDAAEERGRVTGEGGQGKAAGCHAQVENSGAVVAANTRNGEGRRCVVELKADVAY